MKVTLSDKRIRVIRFGESDKVYWNYRGEDVKKAIKEILFHKKCIDCGLNLCNCGKQNWVVDVNVIKEEFGDKLT